MRHRIPRICFSAMMAVVLLSGAARGQTLFLCEDEGRSFVVSGAGAPDNCREIARPEAELQLSGATPDLADILRQLDRQSARIDRLEVLMQGSRARRPGRTLSSSPSTDDPFDSRGRMRDLSQDLRLQLNGSR